MEKILKMMGVSVTPLNCECGCGATNSQIQPGHGKAVQLDDPSWRAVRCQCSTRTRYFNSTCNVPKTLSCGENCTKQGQYGYAHADA